MSSQTPTLLADNYHKKKIIAGKDLELIVAEKTSHAWSILRKLSAADSSDGSIVPSAKLRLLLKETIESEEALDTASISTRVWVRFGMETTHPMLMAPCPGEFATILYEAERHTSRH